MPEWLSSRLPEGWTTFHVAVATVAVAVTMAAISAVVVAFALARLPPDYFVNRKIHRRTDRHPVLRGLFCLLRNLAGYALIVLGVALSLPGVPGQGILTILMGVMLIDFPGKHRAELWLVTRKSVFGAVNKLRAKLGRPPLLAEWPAGGPP